MNCHCMLYDSHHTFIIARQHAVRAERDTVLANLSVCPSVSHPLVCT